MSVGPILALSLGPRMALFGLVLGGGTFLLTRGEPRRPLGPYGRGQWRTSKALAIPLLLVGVAGLVLWAVDSLS